MKKVDDCVRLDGFLATVGMEFLLTTRKPNLERRMVLIQSIYALDEETYRVKVEYTLPIKRDGQQEIHSHETVDVRRDGPPMLIPTGNFVPLYAKTITDEEFNLLPEYMRQRLETEHYGYTYRLNDLVTLGDRSASNLGAEEVDHRVAMIGKDGTLYVWEAAKFPDEFYPEQSLFRIEFNGEVKQVSPSRDVPMVRPAKIPRR